jgi:uncharacterized protein
LPALIRTHWRAAMNKACALVIVMAKYPALGRGKSRLAAELGRVEALRINRFLHHCTRRAASDARWRTLLAVSPDAKTQARWPGAVGWQAARAPQGRGDLGARMQRLAAHAPHGPIVFIGTDCIGLRRGDIARAVQRARQAGVCVIPATDGGFVLLAARDPRSLAGAFTGVRWSSVHTLADVAANLAARGQRFCATPPMSDVDTAADWRRTVRVRVSAS